MTPEECEILQPPWCVRSFDRHERVERDFTAVIGRERWCKLRAQPTDGEPHYRDSVTTACGFHVVLPGGFERRAPTCDAEGCAPTPTKEETRAEMRRTVAQLRDGSKRIAQSADRLSASIERCEHAFRAAEFWTAVSIRLDGGVLWWDTFVGSDDDSWRLLYDTGAGPVQLLTNSPMSVRIEAATKLDSLLDTLLAAEE